MEKKYKSVLKKNIALSFFVLFLVQFFSCSDDDKQGQDKASITRVSIIPLPTSLSHGLYNILIPAEVSISKNITGVAAELLTESLNEITQVKGAVENESAFIRIFLDNTIAPEGYRISVEDNGCNIYYSSSKGLLWGIQTMRQILLQNSKAADGTKSIPMLTLSDSPRKEWRGFHIDVARHMFTIDYLEKVIDCLSFYKINKLQLHLTDDQGWRIEIKKYPELTEVGAWREFDEYDNKCIELAKTDKSFEIDSRFIRNGKEYGGYYTQDELKGLIDYAAKRGIDIIPEIDMPGHFSSAIRTFPNLSCTGKAGWGKEFSYPVCAGKKENYPFFKDILDEVAALFPSSHFHIGGDEVEKDNWEKCPYCQKLIKEEGLRNTDELQNYFIREMANHIRSKNSKIVMAWDDAFIPQDPQELVYTYWRDWMSTQPAKITQQGYPLIFSDWGHFYLSADPSDEALQALYDFQFEPQFKGIVKSNFLGFQACVWTEMIPNETKFGQHVFPSMQAFSELAWGSQRDWTSFTTRISWHLNWLNSRGFETRTPEFVK